MLLDKIFKHNKKPVEMYCGNMIEKAESVNANLKESDNVLKEEFQMKSEKCGDFLLWNMSDLEARDLCKNRIDAMEKWSRRLIDEKFKETYGDEYFEAEVFEGQSLVKASIKRQVEGRMNDNPGRFARKVDALVIEDLEYFFCRDDLYKAFFKEVFEPFFSGQQEVRTVLKRISDIRNKIAHGNHLSQHELEQGVCYPNDFIAVFIGYYKKIGKEKVYNVPTFLSVRDSWGRIMNREDASYTWEISDRVFSNNFLSDLTQTHLRSGDTYRIILEVDASFPEEFYEIKWCVTYSLCEVIAKGKGNVIEFKVDDKCVSYTPCIYADLITKRSWHRFANIGCDDHIEIHLSEVFPPIEDEFI
ncbi:MAG: hypothetical protein E7295_07530 [Lachnospiraceae bacterium]|jgi:hypothetical protein|nr:hypothetical protein [Lachnospiraceae bacterium]